MSFADLLKLADGGDANAQYKVGEHYVLHENYTQAYTYHQLSAKQNHPEALNRVGWYYSCGYVVAKNDNKAFEYYLLSAEQKCFEGYTNVANCYEKGIGVKQDLNKALEYYRLSGSQRHIGKCERLILKQFSDSVGRVNYVYKYAEVTHKCAKVTSLFYL